MFSEHLFDHKYDIDALVQAFCGSSHNGRWLLNSRTGEVIAEAHAGAPTASVQDGDDSFHWHVITPLPPSFLSELSRHPKLNKLNNEDRSELIKFINLSSETNDLIKYIDNGRAGGWLRERIKDAVLDWLEMRDMIPPSMRHVRDSSLFGAPPAPSEIKKVKIQ